jgi:hypothetical protein
MTRLPSSRENVGRHEDLPVKRREKVAYRAFSTPVGNRTPFSGHTLRSLVTIITELVGSHSRGIQSQTSGAYLYIDVSAGNILGCKPRRRSKQLLWLGEHSQKFAMKELHKRFSIKRTPVIQTPEDGNCESAHDTTR